MRPAQRIEAQKSARFETFSVYELSKRRKTDTRTLNVEAATISIARSISRERH
jgi:hypothetical protein